MANLDGYKTKAEVLKARGHLMSDLKYDSRELTAMIRTIRTLFKDAEFICMLSFENHYSTIFHKQDMDDSEWADEIFRFIEEESPNLGGLKAFMMFDNAIELIIGNYIYMLFAADQMVVNV